jgi:hypothetical protein
VSQVMRKGKGKGKGKVINSYGETEDEKSISWL